MWLDLGKEVERGGSYFLLLEESFVVWHKRAWLLPETPKMGKKARATDHAWMMGNWGYLQVCGLWKESCLPRSWLAMEWSCDSNWSSLPERRDTSTETQCPQYGHSLAPCDFSLGWENGS